MTNPFPNNPAPWEQTKSPVRMEWFNLLCVVVSHNMLWIGATSLKRGGLRSSLGPVPDLPSPDQWLTPPGADVTVKTRSRVLPLTTSVGAVGNGRASSCVCVCVC